MSLLRCVSTVATRLRDHHRRTTITIRVDLLGPAVYIRSRQSYRDFGSQFERGRRRPERLAG